jgi:hypothetical protein
MKNVVNLIYGISKGSRTDNGQVPTPPQAVDAREQITAVS